MIDQELLKLAAKVAGYKLGYFERKAGHRDEPTLYKGFGLLTEDGRDWTHWPHFWNPLEDDGDALRLAVRIVQLTSFYRFMKAFIQAFRTEEHFSANDGCLPTRRAITRAAAEIGKTKP